MEDVRKQLARLFEEVTKHHQQLHTDGIEEVLKERERDLVKLETKEKLLKEKLEATRTQRARLEESRARLERAAAGPSKQAVDHESSRPRERNAQLEESVRRLSSWHSASRPRSSSGRRGSAQGGKLEGDAAAGGASAGGGARPPAVDRAASRGSPSPAKRASGGSALNTAETPAGAFGDRGRQGHSLRTEVFVNPWGAPLPAAVPAAADRFFSPEARTFRRLVGPDVSEPRVSVATGLERSADATQLLQQHRPLPTPLLHSTSRTLWGLGLGEFQMPRDHPARDQQDRASCPLLLRPGRSSSLQRWRDSSLSR